MSIHVSLTLLAILVLLGLSAFFNASETALSAVSRSRMHILDQEGNGRASLVNRLLDAPDQLIGAMLIGSTLVDTLAIALASSLMVSLFGDVGIVYAVVPMTLVLVVFSAVLPKTRAMAAAEHMALSVAPVMQRVVLILKPVIAVTQVAVRYLLKLTPGNEDDEANILAAREQLRGTIEIGAMGGAVAKADARMLGAVLDLRELQVFDIMVHRTKMVTVNIAEPATKIVEDIIRSQYSRVPVWKGQPDNFVGVLHSKDLLEALARTNFDIGTIDIMSLVAKPWFVPDTTSVKDQLNEFLHHKSQLALVVDEYGEVQGLVTLEDILEEIVGQIADEHDTEAPAVRPQADGSVVADGVTALRDLNRQMEWDLPNDEASTIAGLVIHEAQTIPDIGQAFTFHGYRFEILRKARNRLTSIRVRRLDPQVGRVTVPGTGDKPG